jgi:hypothetical protein
VASEIPSSQFNLVILLQHLHLIHSLTSIIVLLLFPQVTLPGYKLRIGIFTHTWLHRV